METTTTSLLDGFRTPLPAWSPNPLWWWSGDTLDESRLKWQLERFREGGVYNLTVICLAPAGPLYGHFADDPPFMSPRWWEIFESVCDHAAELGMHIWFYDQIGFSGANFQGGVISRSPEFVGQTIERMTMDVSGPVCFSPSSGSTPLMATVQRLTSAGIPDGLPVPVPVLELASWNQSEPVRLSIVYSSAAGFDYYNPAACAALFESIHGEFERHVGHYFGSVIPGSFQDELPPLPRWGQTFAATFEQMHGYDLVPELTALWEDFGEQSRRVRHDYHATRAHLAEEAFFRPLHDWHQQRGMIIGVDQQNPARAGDPIGTVDIYADYMKTHRWFSAPGSDHHGEAKLHSSLAHLYDHPRVWIESFHSSGWDGTIEETFDWLVPWLRAGANLYNPHATYYSTRGGWFEWAPPATDWRQPYWRHYRSFADAVARLCWLLTQGRHDCDVALVFPTSTVQAGTGLDGNSSDLAQRAHDTYLNLVGRMVWFAARPGLLDQAGIDYDILDDASVDRAVVMDGGLEVSGERYTTVILPACTDLERETAIKLVEFARNGGTILALASLPERLIGSVDPLLLDTLRHHIKLINDDELTLWLEATPLVRADVPTMVRRVEDETIVFVPGTSFMASVVSGWPLATVDFDRSRYAQEQRIVVRGVSGGPTLWNAFTGASETLPDHQWRPVDDGVEVTIPASGAPCSVLVWANNQPAPLTQRVPISEHHLSDVWSVTLEPTLDNRWGDFTWPPSPSTIGVEQWTLHGEDHSERMVASFGPRGRWIGPDDPATLRKSVPDHTWKIASWSLSRGIHRDPLHRNALGPAGHVPEDVVDFGMIDSGQAVRFRTAFNLDDAFDGWLVLGSAAAADVWIDDATVLTPASESERFQRMIPVSLTEGHHVLDMVLTSEFTQRVRLTLCLVTDAVAMRRPDRLTILNDDATGHWAEFATTFDLAFAAETAHIQVATRGPATILVDGEEVGRQGGFLPYGDGSSTNRYDIAAWLTHPGSHTLAVRIDDTGVRRFVAVDGVVTFANGAADGWIVTNPDWSVSSAGQPLLTALDRKQIGDPALLHLRQRPHPLPDASWLEGASADPGIVQRVAWFDEQREPSTGVFTLTVPPGAIRARIPVIGRTDAHLNDVSLGTFVGIAGSAWQINLPDPGAMDRVLRLKVDQQSAFSAGAPFDGPVTYDLEEGKMHLVPWSEVGLGDFSGVMTYRQDISLPSISSNEQLMLDLGDVRGSVGVRIDSVLVATCVVAPFRVDLTPFATADRCDVRLEIEVASSLGAYMQATSPTPFEHDADHRVGLFGPVRLVVLG